MHGISILCFAWQNKNIVFGFTTVHTVDKTTDFVTDRKKTLENIYVPITK